ncbi:uncharacterized protein BDR25DRAFT_319334 [Lindgomyces ingoldianus]|uniref:Uncharacterized protein n=1 Tax=Lindgomyces ingoldianus TaxID=673940 RepID=A0ACB6QBF2_9PLEO|nr:uncharacterized protein BDR25DRAFT_319334 [Lindgomyces ingoldianus]KAF2464268.1 hypothetical protein BDR25DRAFT_319334 [Lindgomyces ingoldianus]
MDRFRVGRARLGRQCRYNQQLFAKNYPFRKLEIRPSSVYALLIKSINQLGNQHSELPGLMHTHHSLKPDRDEVMGRQNEGLEFRVMTQDAHCEAPCTKLVQATDKRLLATTATPGGLQATPDDSETGLAWGVLIRYLALNDKTCVSEMYWASFEAVGRNGKLAHPGGRIAEGLMHGFVVNLSLSLSRG